jgi:hypothetical protein
VAKGVIWNPGGSIRIVERAATAGAVKVMQEVFAASQAQVPKRTLRLQRSGQLRVNSKSVSISYTAPYAGEQHENLHYRHRQGQKAKYLEDPFNQIARTKTGRVVSKMIDEALGGSR